MPSISVENYLKVIYTLETREGRAKNKRIAEALEVRLPSVTSKLKSLAADGLVDYEPYKGAKLTSQGTALALKVIRKHRLIEMFLVETLGFGWDEVHPEAELLEHAVSDTVAARIEAFLDYPKTDPHGDPIPSAEGEIAFQDAQPLSEFKPTSVVRVTRVLDQSPDVLRYLTEVGLTLTAVLEVDSVLPFDGQMTLKTGDETLQISRILASKLLVTRI